MSPLDAPATSAFGLFLNVTAHVGGWPVVKGGSGNLTNAFVTALNNEGVIVHVDRPFTTSVTFRGHERRCLIRRVGTR